MQDNIVMPEKKWEFDEKVTAVFDNMLQRSIPAYEDMRKLVERIGRRFIKLGTYIVDIGCSNGRAIEPFFRKYGYDNKYMMIDTSKPMLEECKKRFGESEELKILDYDITKGLPRCEASLVLSVLSLQFTPIEYRHKILSSIYDSLIEGGAVIVVEKVLGNTYEIDSALVDEYYKIKSDNAYTQEQIQSKRKSLEGVLVPITARWNEDLLKETGFRQVDCFWRFLNFAGWVAIK